MVMKKVNYYMIAAAILFYLCVAFVTLEINPLKWSENTRLIVVIQLLFFQAMIYTYPRDKK